MFPDRFELRLDGDVCVAVYVVDDELGDGAEGEVTAVDCAKGEVGVEAAIGDGKVDVVAVAGDVAVEAVTGFLLGGGDGRLGEGGEGVGGWGKGEVGDGGDGRFWLRFGRCLCGGNRFRFICGGRFVFGDGLCGGWLGGVGWDTGDFYLEEVGAGGRED